MSDIVIVQRISASPSIVYAYLTDADLWRQWQGVDCMLDPRPGGTFSMLMGNGMNARGQFIELVPERRVVFSWGWVDQPAIPPGSTVVEIDLQPDGSETILVLTHRTVPEDEAAAQRAGWTHYLPRLALVASGQDPGDDPTPRAG